MTIKRYWVGTDEEGPYSEGPFPTFEEAHQAGLASYDEPDDFIVGLGREVGVAIDGRWIVENTADIMYDDLYEDALDVWCSKIPEPAYEDLGKRLTAVFHDWLREHKQQTSFEVIELVEDHGPSEVMP